MLQDIMRHVTYARLGASWLEQNRHLLHGNVDIPHAAHLTEQQVRSWIDSAVDSDVPYQSMHDATLFNFVDERDLRFFVSSNACCCVSLDGAEYIANNAFQP